MKIVFRKLRTGAYQIIETVIDLGNMFSEGLFEPSFSLVADDAFANLLAYGKSDAHAAVGRRLIHNQKAVAQADAFTV